MGKIQEIIDSHQAPGFLGLSDGHGALRDIKSNKIKEMVKEGIYKRRNRDERLDPKFTL